MNDRALEFETAALTQPRSKTTVWRRYHCTYVPWPARRSTAVRVSRHRSDTPLCLEGCGSDRPPLTRQLLMLSAVRWTCNTGLPVIIGYFLDAAAYSHGLIQHGTALHGGAGALVTTTARSCHYVRPWRKVKWPLSVCPTHCSTAAATCAVKTAVVLFHASLSHTPIQYMYNLFLVAHACQNIWPLSSRLAHSMGP